MIKIAPSLLSADFSKLNQEIKNLEDAGADLFHLDIMDGHFVPNLTFGAPVVAKLRKHTKLPFDIHLMVENPDNYLEPFYDAGANSITVHLETSLHLNRTINKIKDYGLKACVALNPATPVFMLKDIASELDMILIMSVNPGFGGQNFIHNSVNKIIEVKSLLKKVGNIKALIQVDGGVCVENVSLLKKAGANILVAGSAIFNAKDKKEYIKLLKA